MDCKHCGDCKHYLKPEQSPADRMRQDQEEILGLMKLLQAEKERNEKLKLVVQDVVSTNAINTEERDRYLHERDAAIVRAEAAEAASAKMKGVCELLAAWDHCWPGNVNLEGLAHKARAALGGAS